MTDERAPTSKPKEYTKKPVTIQAIRWTGTNLRDVITFTDGPPNTRSHHAGMMWDQYEDLVSREGLKIYAIEGVHTATVGDMIIRGVRGEFYFCNHDIFEETYSPATAMQPALAEAERDTAWNDALEAAASEMDMAAHIMSHHGSFSETETYKTAAKSIRQLKKVDTP